MTQVLQTEQATPTKKTVTSDTDVTFKEVPSSTQETITLDNNVTSKEVLSSTQVFNSGFVNEIKDPCIEKAHKKRRLVVQARNDNKNLALTQSPKLQWAYIQSNSDFYRNFYIRPAPKQILLLGTPSDGIVKVIKPLHDVPETSANCFAIYHLHYKDEQVSNPIRTSVCAANCLYFGYNLDNLSMASPFTRDGRACTTEPGLVTKKGEPPRTALDLSNLQSLSLLFSLMIFKYALVSGWQLSSALASFPMLADYPSVKLTSEAYLSFSHATKTVKSSPDNIALVYKQLQRQITNSELYAMAHRFGIEKRHWGRYQIVQKKVYQHQHYGWVERASINRQV